MRFSNVSLLTLPALALAQQNPLDQALGQAQIYFDKFQGFIPHFNTFHAAEEAAAKAGGNNVEVLTLNTWKSVLLSSVKPASTIPETWWVLLTGGNKTCYGRCEQLNTAYNQTALLFKAEKNAPHLGYVNCDLQPILCNSWASGPPTLWIFDVGQPGTPTPAHIVGLNTTSVSVKTFQNLKTNQNYKKKGEYTGYFHPFDGQIAQFGLSIPLAWTLFIFAAIPSWMFMIGISFVSRGMMGRGRAGGLGGPAPAAGAARPRGAPPGDGVKY